MDFTSNMRSKLFKGDEWLNSTKLMQSLDKALKEYHDDLIKLLPPSSLMHCIKGIVNVCMTTYMELLLTSPPKLNLLSLKRIKDDVSTMKNFTSFADLINEEKRCSILRPLLDVVVALEIDKSKLVQFASTTLIASCRDIYVMPILTSVLYIREEKGKF